jgi:hypothetical protein
MIEYRGKSSLHPDQAQIREVGSLFGVPASQFLQRRKLSRAIE